MQNNPLISVIVPVYKVEPYLDACVQSLVDQSYANLEIILVDDGSPDNCGALCDAWTNKDSRIRVIHKENGGLSSARNAGLDIMTGEYVTFVDSDDFVYPDYVQAMWRVLRDNNADIGLCGVVRRMDSTDTIILPKETTDIDADTALTHLADGEPTSIWIQAVNKLYAAKLFRSIRYPVGRIHEDTFTTPLVYCEAKTIVCVREALYVYCVRSDSLSQTITPKQTQDRVDAYNALTNVYRSRGMEQMALFNQLKKYYYIYQVTGDKIALARSRRLLKQLRKLRKGGLFDNALVWYYKFAYPQQTMTGKLYRAMYNMHSCNNMRLTNR